MMDNTVTWFEVATDDPEGAQRFYGGLFGWQFTGEGGPIDYRTISGPGTGGPMGGLFNTKGEFPDHAIFHVQVADVEATCAKSESLGGKVVMKVIDDGAGTDFAYVSDVSGSVFGVFHRR
ncbi:VOC family protein [Nonomuraea longispora]|uniref:VOC family protein n=1 Tax=Nonomuraea longispora TaxID=1848320 RepID=A0A4R4N649_9ACTN|nr:VOC family protein [Nonomuraea longispora]TDC02703.1 VOC family protein [Nonomuraea longispora]